MSEILKQRLEKQQLLTPHELHEANVGLSLVSQWQKRKSGELKFLRVGKRIFYTPEFITEFLAGCNPNVTAQENVVETV